MLSMYKANKGVVVVVVVVVVVDTLRACKRSNRGFFTYSLLAQIP